MVGGQEVTEGGDDLAGEKEEDESEGDGDGQGRQGPSEIGTTFTKLDCSVFIVECAWFIVHCALFIV